MIFSSSFAVISMFWHLLQVCYTNQMQHKVFKDKQENTQLKIYNYKEHHTKKTYLPKIAKYGENKKM